MFYFYIFVYVHVGYLYSTVPAEVRRGHLELELQVVVAHLILLLRTELRSLCKSSTQSWLLSHLSRLTSCKILLSAFKEKLYDEIGRLSFLIFTLLFWVILKFSFLDTKMTRSWRDELSPQSIGGRHRQLATLAKPSLSKR